MAHGVGNIDFGNVLQQVVTNFQRIHQGALRCSTLSSYTVAGHCAPGWSMLSKLRCAVQSLTLVRIDSPAQQPNMRRPRIWRSDRGPDAGRPRWRHRRRALSPSLNAGRYTLCNAMFCCVVVIDGCPWLRRTRVCRCARPSVNLLQKFAAAIFMKMKVAPTARCLSFSVVQDTIL